MFYFLKSLEWSKHYGVDIWYNPNSNSYTRQIIEAGTCTEGDRDNPYLCSIIADRGLELVPINQGIINEVKKQLLTQKNNIKNEISMLQEELKHKEKELQKIEGKFIKINNFEVLLNS